MGIIGRLLLCGALLIAATPAAANAQTFSGYGVAGVGGFSAFFDTRGPVFFTAGGFEAVGGLGIGGGGEAGLFVDNSGAVLGVLSFNGVYAFRPGTRGAIAPFLTGGYTLAASPESSFTAFNIGGGLNWYSQGRTGLRVEFRDHVRPDRRGTSHYWSLRAGIVIR